MTEKETRRTRLKAADNAVFTRGGELSIDGDNLDKYGTLCTITHGDYVDSLTFNDSKRGSHLIALPAESLKFEDGILKFENIPFSEATLMELSASDKKRVEIEHFDLPLLTMLYTIILNDLNDKYKDLSQLDDISSMNASVKIFIPDLARLIGMKGKLNKANTDALVNRIASFNSIFGILKNKNTINGNNKEHILPVLLFLGYDGSTNTIEFTSPYMTRLIHTIYLESVKRDSQGEVQYQKNGEIERNPAYSKLIKTSIVNEKNKVAVEIVFEVIKVIERAGSNNVPNIKAATLVERVPQLSFRLKKISESNVKNPRGNINTALKRAFQKAWELLDTQTHLKETYKDINLPDPNDPKNIPKLNTLQQVFTFAHKGKIKEK